LTHKSAGLIKYQQAMYQVEAALNGNPRNWCRSNPPGGPGWGPGCIQFIKSNPGQRPASNSKSTI